MLPWSRKIQKLEKTFKNIKLTFVGWKVYILKGIFQWNFCMLWCSNSPTSCDKFRSEWQHKSKQKSINRDSNDRVLMIYYIFGFFKMCLLSSSSRYIKSCLKVPILKAIFWIVPCKIDSSFHWFLHIRVVLSIRPGNEDSLRCSVQCI